MIGLFGARDVARLPRTVSGRFGPNSAKCAAARATPSRFSGKKSFSHASLGQDALADTKPEVSSLGPGGSESSCTSGPREFGANSGDKKHKPERAGFMEARSLSLLAVGVLNHVRVEASLDFLPCAQHTHTLSLTHAHTRTHTSTGL